MGRPSIKLYYDLVSPFAYIAYHILRTSPTFKDVDVTFVPVFLGGIMKACDNRPPISIKNKDKWIDLERRRWATVFNIPIADSAPDGFPILTIAPMRALTHIHHHHPSHLVPITTALFTAIWGPPRNSPSITNPATLSSIIASVAGPDVANDVLTHLNSDDTKKALVKASDEAVGEGAFGLPWMIVEDGKGGREAYWGVDHLGMVCEFLGLERVEVGGGKGWRSVL